MHTPSTDERSAPKPHDALRSPDRHTVRSIVVTLACLLGVLVLAYAIVAVKLRLTKPVIAVDTVERLRASLPAASAPDEIAWPACRDAFLALGLAAGDPERESPGAKAVDELPFPGTDAWPAATAWLDAHRPALGAVRDATRRPVFGFPLAREFDAADEKLFGADAATNMRTLLATRNDPSKLPILGLLLPHLAKSRAAGRMLVLDAFQAAEAGDAERFVADVEATMRLSFHVQEGRFLICDLVGIAIRSMALQRAVAALEWKPDLLDAGQLLRLQRAFESMPRACRTLNLDAERLMWVDLEQRLFSDRGDGDGTFLLRTDVLIPLINSMGAASKPRDRAQSGAGNDGRSVSPLLAATLLSGPVASVTVADRRETREFVDTWMRRMEEASALPLRDRPKIEALNAEFHDAIDAAPVRLLLPRVLMPALAQASSAYARDAASMDAAAAACAVLRYRLDHAGALPARVEDLVPSYLATVPEDPWTGKPARIATGAGGFSLYSVGEDLVDGGGDPLNPIDWTWFAPRGDFRRWQEPTER